MIVKELIKELGKFDENEVIRGIDIGGSDLVCDVIDFDEDRRKTKYPTIRIGNIKWKLI